MMFVNDVAGVTGTPAWMEHIHPEDADGMTAVDIVFPAFLFIVGMSIPFSVGRRLEQGAPLLQVWGHILVRTVSLLIIGVFMVNTETISENGPLSPPAWNLLTYAGVALLWIAFPGEIGRRSAALVAMRAVGIAILVTAALVYRGNDASGLIQLRTQWWGILGLIGWAYLVACAVYVPLRRSLAGIIGAIPLLYCVYIADAAGGLGWLGWIKEWVSVGEVGGSLAAITVSGIALGMIFAPDGPIRPPVGRIRWGLGYGLALFTAGHLLHAAHDVHRMFMFNKIFATPPWCLVSSAITVWVGIAIYGIVDLRRSKGRTSILALAGQNALLAYILAPVLYAFINLLESAGIPAYYEQLGAGFTVGFWRSVAFAVLVTWLAAVLRRKGIGLKL